MAPLREVTIRALEEVGETRPRPLLSEDHGDD
jgi:hypothetical protein